MHLSPPVSQPSAAVSSPKKDANAAPTAASAVRIAVKADPSRHNHIQNSVVTIDTTYHTTTQISKTSYGQMGFACFDDKERTW